MWLFLLVVVGRVVGFWSCVEEPDRLSPTEPRKQCDPFRLTWYALAIPANPHHHDPVRRFDVRRDCCCHFHIHVVNIGGTCQPMNFRAPHEKACVGPDTQGSFASTADARSPGPTRYVCTEKEAAQAVPNQLEPNTPAAWAPAARGEQAHGMGCAKSFRHLPPFLTAEPTSASSYAESGRLARKYTRCRRISSAAA